MVAERGEGDRLLTGQVIVHLDGRTPQCGPEAVQLRRRHRDLRRRGLTDPVLNLVAAQVHRGQQVERRVQRLVLLTQSAEPALRGRRHSNDPRPQVAVLGPVVMAQVRDEEVTQLRQGKER